MGNDDFSLQTDMHCIIIYISSLSSLCHHHRTCSCSFSMRDSSWPSSTCCLRVVPRFATIYVDHFVSCQKIVKASPIYLDHFVSCQKIFKTSPFLHHIMAMFDFVFSVVPAACAKDIISTSLCLIMENNSRDCHCRKSMMWP